MIVVLDASALIAFLRDESGAAAVEAMLVSAALESEGLCYVHLLNVIEVFYDTHRQTGEAAAQLALAEMASAGVITRADMDDALWQDAARLKSTFRRVSLADCLGLALARRLDADFLTGDRHELEALQSAGVCSITFI